jgi:hypothetical protein
MSYVESGDARRVLLPFADGIGFAPRGDRAPDGRPTATAAAPADPPPILFENFRECGRVRQSVTFAHRYTLACARYNLFHAHTKWARQD